MSEVKKEATEAKVEKTATTTVADNKTARPTTPAATGAPAHRRPAGEGRPFQQRRFRKMPRRKVCVFCVDKVDNIDYKDVNKIKKFITEKGKILPRRQTGNCATHQRKISTAVKRARYMALIPYVGE